MLRPRRLRLAAFAAPLFASAVIAGCSNGSGAAASPTGVIAAMPTALVGASAAPTATAASASPTPPATPRPTARPTATKAPAKPVSPPAANATATTGRVYVADAGFEITLPDGWKRLALDGSIAEDLAKVFPPNSDLGRLMSSQVGKAAIAGVKLWAFDIRPSSLADGYASNLTVTVARHVSGLSIGAYRELLVAQMKAIKEVRHLASTLVTVPAGPAIRVVYDLAIAAPTGGSMAISGTEYVVQDASHTYIVTFSCDAADTNCPKAADAAIRTLRAVH